jgi:hypothetical protein
MQTTFKNKRCAICSSSDIELVYSCPLMPLGGQLIDTDDEFEPEIFYPLHYAVCHDCSAFQSVESVPDHLLCSENTIVSSISDTIVKRDYDVFSEIKKLYGLDETMFVIDVGGSDGVFLQNFLNENIRVLNIEPGKEVAEAARKRGIETISEFLTEDTASSVVAENGSAYLVVAKQVLEGVPDLHGFLKSAAMMLAEDGRIMIEVPYVKDLVEGNFYDLLAHLRKYHFSLTSLNRLFSIHDLAIERVIRYSSLGGGLRFYAGWKDNISISDSVGELLKEEQQCGMNESGYYLNSLKRGVRLKRDLLKVIDEVKEEGKIIVGFGAGIKASALLNFCGLDGRYIEYLVDNGEHKQGKLMPGVRLPVFSPDRIDGSIDYILHLAWLHRDEIINLLKPFTDRGGKIIIPTPEVHIWEKTNIDDKDVKRGNDER